MSGRPARNPTVVALSLLAVRESAGVPVCPRCGDALRDEWAVDRDGLRTGALVFRCAHGCPPGPPPLSRTPTDVPKLLQQICRACGEPFAAMSPKRIYCDRGACHTLRARLRVAQHRARRRYGGGDAA